MSTVSIRIDESLWKKVSRKMKKKRQSIISYVNEAVEEKLARDKKMEDIGKGDIPLPADYSELRGVSFVDPFGQTHKLK